MNIFWAITSWLQWYDAFSKTKVWSDVIWKAKEIASPITQAFTPAIETAKKTFTPVSNIVTGVTKPAVQDMVRTKKVDTVKKPYQEQLTKLGITAQQLDELGLSDEEKQAVKELYSQVGVEIPWISQKVQINDKNKNASQRNWILENVGWSINDVIWGAISEVPNVVWNAVWFANDISQYNPASYIGGVIWDLWKSVFTDKTFSQARQESSKQTEDMTNTIKWIWKKGKEFAQNNLPFDPNSTSAKVWETITDIWASLIWPNKLWVFRPWFLWTTAKLASEWAIQWAKYWIASEWKIDPKQVAIWAVWNTLIWWALWKAWSAIKKSWEALYKSAIKPTADEARMLIKASARWITAPTTRADTALKYGITGTEKQLWVKWVRASDKIFKETVNPAIEKSKAVHNIDDIFSRVEKQISSEWSALRKQELIEWLQALKKDFATTGKKQFTTKDLQLEKSSLDQFTPAKIFKWKDVAQWYNQVKNTLANIMREQVREDLGKVWVKNAKELYKDWANLTQLEDVGVKWITEGGLKWWFWTFWSTVYDKIATPIKTTGGKYIYKLWNWIEYVWPKWLDTLEKFLKSKGYKVTDWVITNLWKNVNSALIRSPIILGNSNSWMDRNTIK